MLRRRIVFVSRVTNGREWVITPHDLMPKRRAKRKPDWSTCPGTLHELYPTRVHAIAAVHWWYGKRVRILTR